MIPKQLEGAKFIKIKKGEKIPVDKWQEPENQYTYQEALTFSKKYNVGIICGSSNIRVIDIEGEEKGNKYYKELCENLDKLNTLTIKTPNGGKHYYIWNEEKHDQAYIILKKEETHCGEYRIKNCFVLIPPSIIEDKKYEIQNKNKIQEIPTTDLQKITKQKITNAEETKNKARKVKTGYWEILKKTHPTEQERVSSIMQIHASHKTWNIDEVFDYVCKHNNWEDFNPDFTREKIEYIWQYTKKENPLEPEKITIKQVREKFRKWLEMENDIIVDLVLATNLNRLTDSDVNLWFFIVGTSGISKTEVVRAQQDPDKKRTKSLARITKNTLVTGNNKFKDLAPQLKGKLVIITDLAIFLKLDPKEKGLIWAQLRDLYDGYARRTTGANKDADYEDLTPMPCLFCSTQHIDNEILLNQVLGSRELVFRVYPEWFDEEKVMEKIFTNRKLKKKMRKELSTISNKFIDQFQELKEIEISPETKHRIKLMGQLITLLRVSAESDPFTGDLVNLVYPERATRIIEQLIELHKCLMNLDPNYDEERAIEIMRHVVLSSIHPIRLSVLEELTDDDRSHSINEISKKICLGWKIIKRELNILKALDIVIEEKIEPDDEDEKRTWKWKLKDSKNGRTLKEFIVGRQAVIDEFLEKIKQD